MSALDNALAHWGAEMPDWIDQLARACDFSSQNKVAIKLGRSSAWVSQVLRGKYSGDMMAAEDLVRGAFMAAEVTCPALGQVPLNECRGWQEKARKLANSNSLSVMMFRACNRCPLNAKRDFKEVRYERD